MEYNNPLDREEIIRLANMVVPDISFSREPDRRGMQYEDRDRFRGRRQFQPNRQRRFYPYDDWDDRQPVRGIQRQPLYFNPYCLCPYCRFNPYWYQ